jgi:hypothetical protein
MVQVEPDLFFKGIALIIFIAGSLFGYFIGKQ